MEGKNNINFGRVWVYNEQQKVNKSIKQEEIDKYISLGFKKGRKLKW